MYISIELPHSSGHPNLSETRFSLVAQTSEIKPYEHWISSNFIEAKIFSFPCRHDGVG